MRTWIAALGCAVLWGLAGCSGTMPSQDSSNQSSGSGVTVFGTIDTNISHTK